MNSRTVPGIKFPVAERPGTTDREVFQQVFVDREYDIPVSFSPQLIIDGGANVGYASIWFANQFPDAQVLAFEIERSNFATLVQNVEPYSNVTPRREALWSRRDTLAIRKSEFEWSGEWDYFCEEGEFDAEKVIPSISIGEVLETSEYDEISILKLDVEGAEKEIFSSDYRRWLDKVGIIIIELHELYAPGVERAFLSAIAGYPFRQTRSGENVVLHRKDV